MSHDLALDLRRSAVRAQLAGQPHAEMLRAAALEIEQLRQDLADASTKSRGHPLDFLFGGIFGPRS